MINQRPRKIPRFKGPFFTWRKNLTTDRNNGLSENLLVYSSGSRSAVLNFLWLKFLWNELTKLEFELFISSLSENEEDEKKWIFLNILFTDISKKTLRKRILEVEILFGLKPSSRERYLGMKGMRFEIQRETRKLSKVRKYSGYVKSISSIGKGNLSSLSEVLSDVDSDLVFYEKKKINWDYLLRVGELTLFSNAGKLSLYHPDDCLKEETKREKI